MSVDNDDIREMLLGEFAKVDEALEQGVRDAYQTALSEAALDA